MSRRSVFPLTIALACLLTPNLFAAIGSWVTLPPSPVHVAGASTSVAIASVSSAPVSYRLAYGVDFSIETSSCGLIGYFYSCPVTFTPAYPGFRQDALEGLDSNGNVVGVEYISAIGQGPVPVVPPGTVASAAAIVSNEVIQSVVADPAGNLFFSTYGTSYIRKMDTQGNVSIIAGTGTQGYSGDGGPASSAALHNPQQLAIDGAGNLYIADSDNQRVRKIDTSGNITTIAGTGTSGYSGDGGFATLAQLNEPYGLALDVYGNLYIADGGNRVIRKVTATGHISTVAGVQGYDDDSGDEGPATAAHIGDAFALLFDPSGHNLYFFDDDNEVVRRIDSNGVIHAFAGSGWGYSGDGGPATSAELSNIAQMTMDPAGNIYLADGDNGRIRKIDTNGIITSIAGNGGGTISGNGGPATSAGFKYLYAVLFDPSGAFWIGDEGELRKMSYAPPVAPPAFPDTVVAAISAPQTEQLLNLGNQNQNMSALATSGDFLLTAASTCSAATPLTTAPAGCTASVAFAPTNTGARTGSLTFTSALQVALTGNGLPGPTAPLPPTQVGQSGAATTVTLAGLGAPPTTYRLAYGVDFTLDPATCAFSGSSASCTVTPTPSTPGVHRDAVLALDNNGNVIGVRYIVFMAQGPLPVIAPGTISSPYTHPNMGSVQSVVGDPSGHIFFSSYSDSYVRKMDTEGTVTVIAGAGSGVDGGPAASAGLGQPQQLVLDGAGNLYIADVLNHRVRKIDRNGIITTVAGTGISGYSGDNGPATAAQLHQPCGLALDNTGNLYIADYRNNVIRKVDVNGIITTVAGVNGDDDVSGDEGPATTAHIGGPWTLLFDPAGNLYIFDDDNYVIRKIDTSGVIHAFAGAGYGYSGDGGAATNAEISDVTGMDMDPAGNIYFADDDNGVVRKIDTNGIITTIAGNGTLSIGGDGGPATSASFVYPGGTYFDPSGTLWIGDSNAVRKISLAAAPALSFPDTAVGSVSAPQTEQLLNLGNQNQSMSAFATSGDFSLTGASTCSAATPLTNAPAGCTAAVAFAPTTTGARTGTLTFTSALQSALTGNALPGPAAALPTTPVGQSGTPSSVTLSGLDSPPTSYRLAYGNDFTLDPTTCASSGSSASCTVVPKPLTPGLHRDAVLALDNNGNVVGTEFITTIGQGPLPIITPGTISSLNTSSLGTIGANGSAFDPAGNLYVTDYNGPIYKITPQGSASVVTITGTVPASPAGIVFDGAGNFYVVDENNNTVVKVSSQGVGSTVVNSTGLYQPFGLAMDSNNNLYVADSGNNRIVRIGADGPSSVFASVNSPTDLTFDLSGNLYVSQQTGGSVKKFSLGGALLPFTPSIALVSPDGLRTDPAGNLYVADLDSSTNKVYRIAPNGASTVVAGNGSATDSGDGGPATSAGINGPEYVALAEDGTMYVMEDAVIRKVDYSPIPLVFSTTNVGAQSGLQAVNVMNLGNAAQDLSALAVSPGFFLDGTSTCVAGTPLAVAASCLAQVGFDPLAGGGDSGTLTFTTNLQVPLSGNGIAPIATPFPTTPIAFGPVTNGTTSAPSVLPIANPSENALNINSAVISGPNAADFTLVQNCPNPLTGNATCSYSVTFTPSTIGAETATLTIVYTDPNTNGTVTRTIALSGAGSNVPQPSHPISNAPVSFGSVPQGSTSAPQSIAVANSTESPLSISSAVISGPNAGDFALTTTCATPVAAGANCAYSVTFTPSATGAETATLTIVYTDPNTLQQVTENIALSGAGSSAFHPIPNTPVAFGSVPQGSSSLPQSIAVDNTSQRALNIGSAIISGPNAADFALTSTCASPVAAGVNCAYSVTFTPSTIGAESATLTIVYTDPNTSQLVTETIALSGTGGQPSSNPWPSNALRFVPLTPCRAIDTRQNGSPLTAWNEQDFVLAGVCGIPSDAKAVSLNITVAANGTGGWLRAWAAGQSQPTTSTLNTNGRTANGHAAILPLGTNGSVAVLAIARMDVVLDVNGYFIDDAAQAAYFPMSACRALDTRTAPGSYLKAGTAQTVTLANTCGLPAGAVAYAVNFTAVPHANLGFFNAWANGTASTGTSILNSQTGQIAANAAIVTPDANGAISVFSTQDTDLVIDISGYFAKANGGLSLYTLNSCRAMDTRNGGGDSAISGVQQIPLLGTCSLPQDAQAYLLNPVAIPNGKTPRFVSLWSDGANWPGTSTLNSHDGSITSNMAIVPTSGGDIQVMTTQPTDLVLDVYGYFAQ